MVRFVLLLALAAVISAQGEAVPRCKSCKQVGLIECKEHRKLELEHEHDVRFCSFLHGCEACDGTGWIDCEDCERPDRESALARKRAAIPATAKGLAEALDVPMKRELRKAQSDHFTLVWEVDELKVNKRRMRDHELMHLYLDRLEELYDAYAETFGVQDSDFAVRSRVFVWHFPEDHGNAARIFCGGSGTSGVKLLGATPSYSVPVTKRAFKNDEQLHRNVVHNVAHLLMSHQRPSGWVGNIKGGWADAGVAHWFEDRFFGLCDNFCYQEVNTQKGFKGGKWRPAVRKLVARDEAPPAAGVMQKNTTALTPEDHAMAFSFVDFLIATDGRKTNKLLRSLRSKAPTREALKGAFGWSVIEFEAAWKAWVLATYPTR